MATKSAKTKATPKTEKPASSGKAQALKLAVDQIEKQFGVGSIMRLGESQKVNVETITSGSLQAPKSKQTGMEL